MWLTVLELTLLLGAAAGGFMLLQDTLGYWAALAIAIGVVLAEGAGYVWLIMVPLWGGKTTGEVTLTKFHRWLLEFHFKNQWKPEAWVNALDTTPRYRNLCYLGTVIWNIFHGVLALGLLGIAISPVIGVGWILWFLFRKPVTWIGEVISSTWRMIVWFWTYSRLFKAFTVLAVLSLLTSGAVTYGDISWFYTSLWILGGILALASLILHGIAYLTRLFEAGDAPSLIGHMLFFAGAVSMTAIVAQLSMIHLNTIMLTFLTGAGSVYLVVLTIGTLARGAMLIISARAERRQTREVQDILKPRSRVIHRAGVAIHRYDKSRKQGICPRVSVIRLT